jgi:hypothetical protein
MTSEEEQGIVISVSRNYIIHNNKVSKNGRGIDVHNPMMFELI